MNFFKKSGSAGPRAGNEPSTQVKELLSGVADKLSVAIMMVDRDFNVTYVNGPTMELLRANADGFRKIWPSFDPERILGTCIDTFHKNPGHQRKMLADTSKMPMNTEITMAISRSSS
ncbi:MAG: PAS domain-containing protein [Xanthobacteraceae bacterium]